MIAEKFVFNNDPQKMRLFRSAVFVPIDGVDFEPYVKLLLSPFEKACIVDKLIVLTDGDSETIATKNDSPGALRKKKFEQIAQNLGSSSLLRVIITRDSFKV